MKDLHAQYEADEHLTDSKGVAETAQPIVRRHIHLPYDPSQLPLCEAGPYDHPLR